jgi:hypothetical protein
MSYTRGPIILGKRSPRIAAIYVALVGAWVFYHLAQWTMISFNSNIDRSGMETALWIGSAVAVLASTVFSAWVITRSELGLSSLITFAISGFAIAVVGSLSFYIQLMLTAQAVFYREHGAQQTLAVARGGLAASVAAFLVCAAVLLRTAFRHRAPYK